MLANCALATTMECPVCKQEMKKVRWDISHNPSADNKEYERTVYQCEADDTPGHD